MSRTEFMSELEALLQDISVDERQEAMQYYTDYFDDAGEGNEAYIITELGSPAKVAATIKAGLRGTDDGSSQYSETGYTDTRFEEKEAPAKRDGRRTRESVWTNTPMKIVLIILIVIVGIPTVIPIVGGLAAAVFGVIIAFFAVLISLVVASAAFAFSGIVITIFGIVQLFVFVPMGLGLVGAGLLIFVLGLIGTVLTGKLCWVVIPAIFKGTVELCRRIFKGKVVSA